MNKRLKFNLKIYTLNFIYIQKLEALNSLQTLRKQQYSDQQYRSPHLSILQNHLQPHFELVNKLE